MKLLKQNVFLTQGSWYIKCAFNSMRPIIDFKVLTKNCFVFSTAHSLYPIFLKFILTTNHDNITKCITQSITLLK